MLDKVLPANEHPVERAVRIVAGIVGVALVFVGPQTNWGWFGLIPLLTGVAGSCPLYTIFGVSTRRPAATPER